MDIPKAKQVNSTSAASARRVYSPIVELRQYTLHPGNRDTLIALFEQAFIETQEAVGIAVIGQFRDLENPNRFVWLRGFPDMDARRTALQAFYGGPVWQAHRAAANATMIDSDNVLLLRPIHPASGFSLDPGDRPPPGAAEGASGPVVATILSLETPPDAAVLDWFEGTLVPTLTRSGAILLATFVTEASVNTFPALPVREGEQVLVWFALLQDEASYVQYAATFAQAGTRYDPIWQAIARHLSAAPQVLKLLPTARSLVHG